MLADQHRTSWGPVAVAQFGRKADSCRPLWCPFLGPPTSPSLPGRGIASLRLHPRHEEPTAPFGYAFGGTVPGPCFHALPSPCGVSGGVAIDRGPATPERRFAHHTNASAERGRSTVTDPCVGMGPDEGLAAGCIQSSWLPTASTCVKESHRQCGPQEVGRGLVMANTLVWLACQHLCPTPQTNTPILLFAPWSVQFTRDLQHAKEIIGRVQSSLKSFICFRRQPPPRRPFPQD